ncbi:MAG: hypothetical protein EBU22_06575 [Actinobacteria bacterium]|nr:hypothetical protein [Actinomycetota bacterium]
MKSFLQFLLRAFKYFRSTKRVWRRPPRADLLIIDRGTASPLDEMFAHHNPHIMDIRGESVNMLALLRALPQCCFCRTVLMPRGLWIECFHMARLGPHKFPVQLKHTVLLLEVCLPMNI